MPSKTRIVFRDIAASGTGVSVGRLEIIDGVSGETIRIARVSGELIEFLSCIEIEIETWYEVQRMKKKNANFTVLINSFKLFT